MPALPPMRPEQPSHLTCPSTGLMCTCTRILAFYLMVKHSRRTSARPWGCTRGLWGSCLGLSARLRGCGCHAGHATAPGAIQDMPQLMVAPRTCHSSWCHTGHARAPEPAGTPGCHTGTWCFSPMSHEAAGPQQPCTKAWADSTQKQMKKRVEIQITK